MRPDVDGAQGHGVKRLGGFAQTMGVAVRQHVAAMHPHNAPLRAGRIGRQARMPAPHGDILGLGAQPPTPSWGRMLAESQTMISFAPHIAIFTGMAIVLTVLGLNLMGDGLRDVFDPRLRRRR